MTDDTPALKEEPTDTAEAPPTDVEQTEQETE